MYCQKCSSIVSDDSETCKFCKTPVDDNWRRKEQKRIQEDIREKDEKYKAKMQETEKRNKALRESIATPLLRKYGLDIDNYSSSQIKDKNIENIQNIGSELAGSGWIKSGLALSFQPYERQSLGYLSVLMEQNWILVRQNELIIRLLEKNNLPKK